MAWRGGIVERRCLARVLAIRLRRRVLRSDCRRRRWALQGGTRLVALRPLKLQYANQADYVFRGSQPP